MLIEACILLFAKELKIDKNDFTLIVFSSKDIVQVEGANGMASPITDKLFTMVLSSRIDCEKLIEVIAHEMVHIKQFAHGETNETLSKWKGISIDSDAIDYYLHPWELEAYSLETGLWTKFAVKEELWDVFEGISNPDAPIKKEDIKWKYLTDENRTSSNG
jgi:hypothetical protein